MNGLRKCRDFIQYKQVFYSTWTNYEFNIKNTKSNLVAELHGDGIGLKWKKFAFEFFLLKY